VGEEVLQRGKTSESYGGEKRKPYTREELRNMGQSEQLYGSAFAVTQKPLSEHMKANPLREVLDIEKFFKDRGSGSGYSSGAKYNWQRKREDMQRGTQNPDRILSWMK
jgi:hypothetical protein